MLNIATVATSNSTLLSMPKKWNKPFISQQYSAKVTWQKYFLQWKNVYEQTWSDMIRHEQTWADMIRHDKLFGFLSRLGLKKSLRIIYAHASPDFCTELFNLDLSQGYIKNNYDFFNWHALMRLIFTIINTYIKPKFQIKTQVPHLFHFDTYVVVSCIYICFHEIKF